MPVPNIEKITSIPLESIELSGIVTVGEESAEKLSKKLGRKVEPGETFDLGMLAYYHKNPVKRFMTNLRLSRKKNLFN